MELKSKSLEELSINALSFNRTFMELKFTKSILTVAFCAVLIVPLWN